MDQIIDAFFQLLQQLILPNWSDLILLVPWVLVAIVLIWLVFSALQWRKAGSRNRARVPRPLAGGAPPPGVHLPGPSRWPFVVPIGAALLLFGFALTPKDAAGNVLAPVNVPIFVVGLIVTLIAVAGWLLDAMREWRRTAVPETDAHVSSAVALAPETASPARRLTWGAPVAAAEPAEPVYVEPPPGVHMPGPSPWPFFAPIGAAVMLYGFIFSSVLIVGGLILSLIAITGWILEAGHEYRSTEAVGHAVPATRDPSRAWPRRLVPIYGAVIVLSLLGTLAPIGISALNSLTPAEATPGPVAVPAQPKIAAANIKFDTGTLIVPAGRPFELVFNNNDASVPHNVQIDASDKSSTVFDGEVITGVASATYNVPALQPGNYYFLCKVHPTMNGTVKAVPEAGGAPPAGAIGGPSPAPQASSAP